MKVREQSSVRAEFESFAKKVAQLESLEREFRALDTKGHEQEAKLIRAKLKDINSIAQVRKDIAHLRNKILQSHKSKKKTKVLKATSPTNVKIDSGISHALDKKFEQFILEIKGELSSRVNEQKKSMHKQFEEDLSRGGEMLDKKYEKLASDLHERYRKRVKSSLKKLVHAKFNAELRKRLDVERKQLEDEAAQERQKLLHSITGWKNWLAAEKDKLRQSAKEEHHQELLLERKKKHLDEKIAAAKVSMRKEEKALREQTARKLRQRVSQMRKEFRRTYKMRLKAQMKAYEESLAGKKKEIKHHIAKHAAKKHKA